MQNATGKINGTCSNALRTILQTQCGQKTVIHKIPRLLSQLGVGLLIRRRRGGSGGGGRRRIDFTDEAEQMFV